MKSKHEKPLQSRSLKTRNAILKAALSQFAERGYEAASLREIGELAGTTHPMVTYHFGSKDGLWKEAVRFMFARVETEVVLPAQNAVADYETNIEAYVKETLWRYVRYCAKYPEHARITIAETVRGGERLQWMVDTFVRQNHTVLMPAYEKLMEEGVIPKMSTKSMVYAMVGMIQLPFTLAKEAKYLYDTNVFDDDWIAEHTETVFQLIFREPAPNHLGQLTLE